MMEPSRLVRSTMVVLAAILVAGGALVGCQSEADPTKPAGAYRMYRQAVLDGDLEAMWKRTSESSHEFFGEKYETLVEMDRQIRKYMPQTDHELARKQTGTEMLDEIDGAQGLFEKMLEPENMPLNQARRLGSEVEKIRMGKDREVARVVAAGGREYRLVRGEDDEWYVDLVASVDAVKKNFGWLEKNEKALEKTVNDIVEKRQEEREKIIADLMDVAEE